MVSEGEPVMSACADFTQNAWKRDLCVNCQRPRGEHGNSVNKNADDTHPKSPPIITADSPKPAKRNSLMTKSWTPLQDDKDANDDDDKWNAMCLPEVGKDNTQKRSTEISTRPDSNSTGVKRETKKTGNDLGTRSRSNSRDKSPVPMQKPKVPEKRIGSVSDTDKHSDTSKSSSPNLSPRSRKKLKKGQRSISFQKDDPIVIGDDGGLDNLYPEDEDDLKPSEQEEREVLKFTEDEKEWALQALKNTLWNSEHINSESGTKKNATSKTLEDADPESLWQPERFANVKDCNTSSESGQNFGTFPLRTKSEKTAMDNMFSANRLSTLSESLESTLTDEDKYESVMKFLNAGNVDIEMSPKHKIRDSIKEHDVEFDDSGEQNYEDPWEDKFAFDADSEMNLLDEIRGEIDLDSSTAGFALVDLLNDVLAKYSTPSECGDSVKNLDLQALVDDEKGEKTDRKDGKEKSAELEAKMGILAASLRKQRAKGRAPRPPSCPPEPPMEVGTKSPAKQLELRAAQSREPTFKMVPIGKPIGSNMSQSTPSPVIQNPLSENPPEPLIQKSETLPAAMATDAADNQKGKGDVDGKDNKQKKSGGFGSFFSRLLRRSGRESDTDVTTSTDTLASATGSATDVSVAGDNQSDKGSHSSGEMKKAELLSKSDKRSSKSSPQMKLKVLPERSVSPKPSEASASKDAANKEVENKPAKPNSSAEAESEKKPKNNLSVDSVSQSSDGQTKEEGLKVPVSPSKPVEKESLPASPKSKEAPPLPLNPPREGSDSSLVPPRPRARGNSDGGPPKMRPRQRDSIDGKPRDTPNVPPPKPPVAAKPRPTVPPPPKIPDQSDASKSGGSTQTKEPLSVTKSLEEDGMVRGGRVMTKKGSDSNMLRSRAKSPKRVAAPAAPVRASMPNIHNDTLMTASEPSLQAMPETRGDAKGLSFAKELEQKLSKDSSSVPDVRKPPPPPPTTAPKVDGMKKADLSDRSKTLPKDNNANANKTAAKDMSDRCKTLPKNSGSSKSNVRDSDGAGNGSHTEKTRARSASKDDLKSSPPLEETPVSMTTSMIELDSSQSIAPDIPFVPEKIELPRAAAHSRKSFLGKLNRKTKPPPPPSVKRTKSITESSLEKEHHLKKIDVKDISGPVLIQEMTSSKVVNRRNTISLGDDNSFLSGGSTSSGSTGERSDMSPHGSLENLYEFIKSEAPTPPVGADRKNLYDPVVEKTVALRPPSITGIEGYLEPVRSNVGQAISEPVKSSTTPTPSMTASHHGNLTGSGPDSQNDGSNLDPSLDDTSLSDERRELLASQPIYEEINGYGKLDGPLNPQNQSTDSGEIVEESVYGVSGEIPLTTENQSNAASQGQTSAGIKSRESFSSESDLSSANNSLSRPRPIPRRRPRTVGSGFEQYVAMNRPSVAVFLNEDQLREMLSKLTAMNLQTLREIYTQHEKCFTKENLHVGAVGPLKWIDFNIYGKPLHTSEKCIVYNAKLKSSASPCQLMLLHSRPEITVANHPSLLKPTCIFTDSVPFAYLTEEFIRTAQILETCIGQNQSKCYIVVGLFDITESVNNHLNSLETMCENQREFLRKIIFFVLQLLSAISHCLEQGLPLAESDFHDLYLISNPYCLGETISFLPQVRSPDDQHVETVCLFLEKFLQSMCDKCEASSVLDDSAFFFYTGVQKCIEMLQSGVVECLPIVRSYTEFLLWGPDESGPEFSKESQTSNVEPKLSMWLEKQRSELIHDFAKRVQRGARCNIRDFYKMKFLLKASSGSLAECIRCHTSDL